MRGIGVVAAHPFRELTVRFEPTGAVVETGLSYRRICIRAAPGHVVIDRTRQRHTALDGDGAITVLLHQTLEEPVTEQQDLLTAVQSLTEAKQFHRRVERRDNPIDSDLDCR